MTTPKGFRIAYAINPHMKNADGSLKEVNSALAFSQWEKLRSLYVTLGFSVDTIEGRDSFPDLVFPANPTFPFKTQDGRAGVVIGIMYSEFRRGESEIYETWARNRGLIVEKIMSGRFEGTGDAIWNFETGEIFGGFGIRTDENVYDDLAKITNCPIHKLQLVDPRFYHLDTCLAILDAKTAAYVPQAFAPVALSRLAASFSDLIPIDLEEAVHGFAGNAFSMDGRNVVLQSGNARLSRALKSRGFPVHEVETGEFIKSGGSVFCMKQQFWA